MLAIAGGPERAPGDVGDPLVPLRPGQAAPVRAEP